METANKAHWENVYETKSREQVSWTQQVPKTSLDFINSFRTDKSAKIIDIGGGTGNLVDFLLDQGYTNISVLEISANALEKSKARLGERASKINWIVSDIIKFNTQVTFDMWHDRATFHFLTNPVMVEKYIAIVSKFVTGYLAMSTF